MTNYSWDRTLDGKLDGEICIECNKSGAHRDGFCSNECRKVLRRVMPPGARPRIRRRVRPAYDKPTSNACRVRALIRASMPWEFVTVDVMRAFMVSRAAARSAIRVMVKRGELRQIGRFSQARYSK